MFKKFVFRGAREIVLIALALAAGYIFVEHRRAGVVDELTQIKTGTIAYVATQLVKNANATKERFGSAENLTTKLHVWTQSLANMSFGPNTQASLTDFKLARTSDNALAVTLSMARQSSHRTIWDRITFSPPRPVKATATVAWFVECLPPGLAVDRTQTDTTRPIHFNGNLPCATAFLRPDQERALLAAAPSAFTPFPEFPNLD